MWNEPHYNVSRGNGGNAVVGTEDPMTGKVVVLVSLMWDISPWFSGISVTAFQHFIMKRGLNGLVSANLSACRMTSSDFASPGLGSFPLPHISLIIPDS